jgi:hypothetical protein
MEKLQLSPDQIAMLDRPLPAEALKAHPTKKDSSGTPMTTIKAIFVIDRLNEVFGVGVWNLKTTYISHDKIVRVTQAQKERTEYISAVHTELSVPSYDIHLECIAGSTNDDLGDALKGGTTDGITKIASYLGIGAHIWRGTKPSRATDPTIIKTNPVKPTAPVLNPKGGMTPSNNFDNQSQETYPPGYLEDLAKMKTFEDLLEVNKKYKSFFGDDSLKAIMSKKMKDEFAKLPAEEQAKMPAKN